MTHEDEYVSATIDPLGDTGKNSSQWQADDNLINKWGYTLDSTDLYKGVPSTSMEASEIKSTDGAINDSYTTVTFGARTNLLIPAGTYSDTVVFSAVANPLPVTDLSGATSMQTATAEMCANTAPYSESGTTYTLVDERDTSQSYKVRKLDDGKCWMVQNLRLIDKTIDSTDSDMASGSFTVPASDDNWARSLGEGAHAHDTGNAEYGVYYNWLTATAGTGTDEMTSGDATSSICPKNWHLPTGNTNGEWYNVLVATFGQEAIDDYAVDDPGVFASSALSLPFSGYFRNGSEYDQGDSGSWWSSTAYDSKVAYFAYVDSDGNVDAVNYDGKYYGDSVRCVLGE